MPKPGSDSLSERGAQIMGVLWELGEATADDIRAALPADLHDSTVRTLLRQLEEKGYVKHKLLGRTFHYQPTVPRENVRAQALRGFIQRFFGGSAEVLVQHLLRDEHLTPEDLDQIRRSSAAGGKTRRTGGKT